MTKDGEFQNRKYYNRSYGKTYYRKGYSVEFMPSKDYPQSVICFNAIVTDPSGHSWECHNMKEVGTHMRKPKHITAEQFQREMISKDGSSFYEDAPTQVMFVPRRSTNKSTKNTVTTTAAKKEYEPSRRNVYVNRQMRQAASIMNSILNNRQRLSTDNQKTIVENMKILYEFLK